jgi:hypothetical protein
MPNRAETKRSRREAFRAAGRFVALGTLGTLAGLLVLRGEKGSSGSRCRQTLGCRGCPVLPRCALPRAEAAKRALKSDN